MKKFSSATIPIDRFIVVVADFWVGSQTHHPLTVEALDRALGHLEFGVENEDPLARGMIHYLDVVHPSKLGQADQDFSGRQIVTIHKVDAMQIVLGPYQIGGVVSHLIDRAA